MPNSLTTHDTTGDRPPLSVRFTALTGFVFVVLQSVCSAVLALSGMRVAIGLTALAAASGTYAPAAGLHQDAIRIPMLIVGGVAAVVNLAVLFRVWRLRTRAAGQWRRRTVSAKERRSERLQLVLSVLTLILIGAEVWTHSIVHRSRSTGAAIHASQSWIGCRRVFFAG